MAVVRIAFPALALAAAFGLCAIAPPRSRSLYVAPVGCTAAFVITLAALAAALIR
ncbi:hypothetical protein [Streptomyces caniscabiei]|uniref:hypothetical protein n=1 Tax=Streptomyces caniscabiei TaxID=2746961 RepID=UPI000A82D2F7|nr:hypothetical protein [Streptomyces caniscabiei]